MSGAGLAALSTGSLADHLWLHGRTRRIGHDFAAMGDRTWKQKARGRVLALFTRERWQGGLSIVTMPGLRWTFERMLLGERERKAVRFHGSKPRTHITGIERDEAIYRASMQHIPGAEFGIVCKEAGGGGTATIRTPLIARYHRTAFEDFARVPWETDAAWLDFNGQVNASRLDALAAYWPNVRHVLVLTALAARGCARPPAILEALPGAVLSSQLRYRDAAPMMQLVLLRADSPRFDTLAAVPGSLPPASPALQPVPSSADTDDLFSAGGGQ